MRQTGGALAGIVIEPIGGATLGATVPPAADLAALRSLGTESWALLIADEVMTDLGRTGRVLGLARAGVTADLTVVAKGLGAGYTQIGAVLFAEPALDAIRQGSGRFLGGHTYAGNPLSAATSLAVLKVLEHEDLIGRAASLAPVLASGLASLAERHDVITESRGDGLLRGPELARGGAPGTTAARLLETAMQQGLALSPATGGFNDAVLVAPPFTITEAELETLLERLDAALGAL